MNVKPNQRLKQERERRGWSQAKLAEEVGIDSTTISRWERGLSLPYPYYRQRLCELFGKTVQELGLFPRENQEVRTHTERVIASSASSPLRDPAIPLLPAGQFGMVGRDTLLGQLKQHLSGRDGAVHCALHGLPGVGKTTLALHLAHDRDLLALFPDGILWAGLGPTPNILRHLSRWATLLGLDTSHLTQDESVEQWAYAIHTVIGTRRFLLVIDDAWTMETTLALKVGGPNCAYLLTTRFPSIALSFTPVGSLVVHELSEDESVTLLERLVPEVTTDEMQAVRALTRLVGGLPLALTLMGNYLRVQSHTGQVRRVRAAIKRLHDVQERLSLSESQAPLEHHSSLPQSARLSLQAVIAVSDQHLDEQSSLALRSLSVFPAKPNSFSEEAALAVCACSVDVLDTLCDAGLLESSGSGRYTLHQTIADYAHMSLSDSSASHRFVTYWIEYVESHEKNYDALEHENTHIFAAFQRAFEDKMKTELLRGITSMMPFLLVRGLYSLAQEHAVHAYQTAMVLEDTVGKGVMLGHLGDIATRRGTYSQAEVYLQEGLSLARQSEHQEHMSWLLTLLGTVAHLRGDFAHAEAYYHEGLLLARQTEHQERSIRLLSNLGSIAYRRGDDTHAEAYYSEGLLLAQQMDHQEHRSRLPTNLGAVAQLRGDDAQAEVYYTQGLLLAQQIGHREYTSILFSNLGEAAAQQKKYQQAEKYYQEGLAIARNIDLRWLIVSILKDLGDLYLHQQKLEAAGTVFHEALTDLPQGSQELSAEVTYGLAQVAFAQGNLVEAHQQGKTSLTTFRRIGHKKEIEVRQWLEKLPLSQVQ